MGDVQLQDGPGLADTPIGESKRLRDQILHWKIRGTSILPKWHLNKTGAGNLGDPGELLLFGTHIPLQDHVQESSQVKQASWCLMLLPGELNIAFFLLFLCGYVCVCVCVFSGENRIEVISFT